MKYEDNSGNPLVHRLQEVINEIKNGDSANTAHQLSLLTPEDRKLVIQLLNDQSIHGGSWIKK